MRKLVVPLIEIATKKQISVLTFTEQEDKKVAFSQRTKGSNLMVALEKGFRGIQKVIGVDPSKTKEGQLDGDTIVIEVQPLSSVENLLTTFGQIVFPLGCTILKPISDFVEEAKEV